MKKEKTGGCKCPFCESELTMSCVEPDFCKPCEVKFVACKKCGSKLSSNCKTCANCGEKIKG